MNQKEKILWLYKKLEEVVNILYDVSDYFEVLEFDKGIIKAIEELWNEFDVGKELDMKIED